MDRLTDVGAVLTPAIVLFTAREVCEQTLLTWMRGMQSMGVSPPQFSLDLMGVILIICGGFWAVIVVVLSIARRQRISATNGWLIAIIVVCCSLWLVPYEEWKLLMIRTHGAARAPKNWIMKASSSGEIHLLDYLLANGADLNAQDVMGFTALAWAQKNKNVEVEKLVRRRTGDRRE